MREKITLIASLITIFLLFTTLLPDRVLAQTEASFGLATYVNIQGGDAKDGSIISYSKDGYKLTTIPYDSGIFGVITDNPQVSFQDKRITGARPVVTWGRTAVLVSTENGDIQKGDLVTSSSVPGVGQKADRVGGYVLGVALENYTGKPKTEIGKIMLYMNIRVGALESTLKTNLLEALRLGIASPILTPLVSLRYLLAMLIILISFALGFIFFGRTTSRGVEALGRNPLAARIIALSMAFNLFLTVVVILAGLALAYLILML